jgi:hypothetical protein
MLVILGYSFNRQDGRLEQGGLLQYASTPSGATVTIDGIPTGSRTPGKSNVDAKSHHVQMSLKGYRDWQKTINIDAGGIGWLSYARLVPSDIKTDTFRVFPQIVASLASKDRKWIAIHEAAASPSFVIANIESDTPKYTTVAIPDTSLTPGASQSFEIVSWSDNSDRLLIKRTYDESKTEWISVNRQTPSETVNLTTLFGIDAIDIKYGERNGSDAYALTSDSVVRRINVGNRTLSEPLAENIESFSIYDANTLLYATKPDPRDNNQRHVGYRESDMNAAQTLYLYPEATTGLHVAFGEYYGNNYVAVTHDTTLSVFRGTLPRGDTKADLKNIETRSLQAPANRLTIGENGRLAVAEMPDGFTTYDIELDKTDSTTFNRPASAPRSLTWIDNYIVANDRGGIVRFYDFDGANQQDIMATIEGQAVTLSGNEKFLYAMTQTDGGIALTRARMTVSN